MIRELSNVALTAGILAGLGVIAFTVSGFGYKWGWWDLGIAFRILIPAGTILAITGFILSLTYVFFIRSDRYYGDWMAFVGMLLSVAVLVNAAYWYFETQKYPPIHDITTDTQNPPEFDAIAPIRANAPNPIKYEGEEIAAIQKKHYPEIGTLYLEASPETAYKKALDAAKETSWEIVSENQSALTIEATHTLPWFGFKDDIVIRVDTTDTGSKIDVRSVSRVGLGDVGVNAWRIRNYLGEVE